MFLIKTNGGINSVNYIRFFSVLDFFSLPFQNSRLNFLLLFLSSYGKNSSEPLLSAVVDSGPGHRGVTGTPYRFMGTGRVKREPLGQIPGKEYEPDLTWELW